jgi:diaminopimelate epimerase
MQLEFFKYQGTGNDFIIVDNRMQEWNSKLDTNQIKLLCDRRLGIGADGLMLLQNHPDYDFEMIYFNANGETGSMCGNGGRCLVQFAKDLGIRKEIYSFLASDGPHEANFDEQGWVNLKMKDVDEVVAQGQHFVLDTGSPHYVCYEKDILKTNVFEKGKTIRYSKEFAEKGINVNFVEQLDEDTIYVRTYERGVEDETLSCGTGVTAAAIVSAHNDRGFNAIEVKTLGGRLRVEYDRLGEDSFKNIWLCGPAVFVFNGSMILEA